MPAVGVGQANVADARTGGARADLWTRQGVVEDGSLSCRLVVLIAASRGAPPGNLRGASATRRAGMPS